MSVSMLLGRSCCSSLEESTYNSHVVEANSGAVHSDAKEGHEEAHVEPRAGKTLEDRSGIGLKSALALRHSVPVPPHEDSWLSVL